MGRRVFVDTIGVLDAGKKCEPATSMSQPCMQDRGKPFPAPIERVAFANLPAAEKGKAM
jgi:hypothetical protein